MLCSLVSLCFFCTDTATTEIYSLSLHDALPILRVSDGVSDRLGRGLLGLFSELEGACHGVLLLRELSRRSLDLIGSFGEDRKSTRLNSSHANISYAVFCLKKKKKNK